MQDIKNNPVIAFINERIIDFKNESFRLRDKSPLVEYKALVDTFFSIIHKLGTIEHEIALAALAEEYKHATREAAQAWKEIWRDFSRQRKSNIELEHHFAHLDSEAASYIREAEAMLKAADPHDEVIQEVLASAKGVLASAKSTVGKDSPKGWRMRHWLLLWANLQIYTVYVRYFIARLWFFVLRHSFIIVVSIIIFGLIYSKLAKFLSGYVSSFVPKWSWAAGLLIILGAAIVKRYYIDAKIKRVQLRLEARWLSRIALNLHCVRTLALLSRTHVQKPRRKA